MLSTAAFFFSKFLVLEYHSITVFKTFVIIVIIDVDITYIDHVVVIIIVEITNCHH